MTHRSSLQTEELIIEMDASVLFHEPLLDESRLLSYNYSFQGFDAEKTTEEDPQRRGSTCCLGQSLRDSFVPRSIYAEEASESESESASEEEEPPKEETKPIMSGPGLSRRGLLAITKSSPPTLTTSTSSGGGSSGGVWKSMRAMTFTKDDSDQDIVAGLKPIKKWSSFKWSTKRTSLGSDDDEPSEMSLKRASSFKLKKTLLDPTNF